MSKPEPPKPAPSDPAKDAAPPAPAKPKTKVQEIGGPPGPEPTRYGDWAIKGRVSDF